MPKDVNPKLLLRWEFSFPGLVKYEPFQIKRKEILLLFFNISATKLVFV